MLQGSLYETLTRKINRPCNFSYLTCVDIILSGGPSTFFFFILTLEHLVNYLCTIVRLYFCPIICFVFVQISCFQIFLCVTHRVHFFFKVKTPRKLIVHNRAPLFLHHHLFCFPTNFLLSNICLFYPSWQFFSAPTRAVIIFNTTSSRLPIYLLL